MKRNVISISLIVIGVILMISSLGFKIYCKRKEDKLINKLNNQLKVENKKNISENKEKVISDKEKNKEKNKEVLTSAENGELAIIQIPSIKLKSVVVEGIEMDKLRYYLGHFKDTALPGEYGNFCIAGHSSYIYNEILNNLNKVKIGDEIKLSTLQGEFNYTITKKNIVKPTEVSVLNQNKKKKEMTIVTCSDGGKNRLIVKAEMKGGNTKNDK